MRDDAQVTHQIGRRLDHLVTRVRRLVPVAPDHAPDERLPVGEVAGLVQPLEARGERASLLRPA